MGALSLIVQGMLMALTAAPQAISVVKQTKALIKTFQKEKIITKEEANQSMDFCNDVQEKSLAGEELPSWTVEPDPKS
jgi:hypothetical protein